MNSTTEIEIIHDFSPYFRVHKDGRVERLSSDFAPPSDDPKTGVRSKDVVVSPETGVSARLFIPQPINPNQKLPLFLHLHGGGFCFGSPSSPLFHDFLTSLVAKSQIIVVSVDYRLAPEHPLPIAYDDSWAALQWALSHADGAGPEPWLTDHADFGRVFLGGESAGANIANDVAIRAGLTELPHKVKMAGLVLVHPYFGVEGVDVLYKFACPSSSGCGDDRGLNPAVDPRLRSLGCRRVMVCLAEKDVFRQRSRGYGEALGKSGWGGEVEMVETEGEDHGFHLYNPTCEKALTQMNCLAAFFNKD